MERFLFLILAVLLGGCEPHAESQSECQFHDDFYYVSSDGKKCDLKRMVDEYYLVIKTSNVDKVLCQLGGENLQVLSGPSPKNFSWDDECTNSGLLDNCSYICVKGNVNLSNVQDVVYWGHVYYAESRNEIMRNNIFWVKYDENEESVQMELLLEYARQHNVIPLGRMMNVMEFACTIYSSGNPIEMANWFMETGKFELAQPRLYGSISIDKDVL